MDDINDLECIVLAGGLGTRLRNTIGDYPKCMAGVNGKPFLYYLFQYLAAQSCRRVVLSLGYKHEVVIDWLKMHPWPFETDYVIEQEPLGTGGGMQLALQKTHTQDIAVCNGDTMFSVSLQELAGFHRARQAAVTIALKEMHHFDRYGVVRTDSEGCILSFEEKQAREQGQINGGVYILNKHALAAKQLPQKFSFEKDYLERYVGEGRFFGYVDDAYFIDIGVPEDYRQAQDDFKNLFS